MPVDPQGEPDDAVPDAELAGVDAECGRQTQSGVCGQEIEGLAARC